MNANSKISHEQTANQSFNWKFWEAFQKNTPKHIPFLVNVPSKIHGPLYHPMYTYGMGEIFPSRDFTKIVQGAPPRDFEGVFFSPVFFCPLFLGGWGMVGDGGGWWFWKFALGMVILNVGGLVILKIWIGGSWFFLGLIF